MAVRIQVRRGTTSEWNTANPTLFQGEFGYNTTLDKFKIGDGSTAWSSLEYVPTSADLATSLGDYIALTEKGGADGVAELDASYNVLTKTAVVFEGSIADAYETTLFVTEPTADRTITLPNATGTVALTSDLSSYATLANPTFTGTVNAAALTLSGDLTVNGTTTTVNSTTVNVTNAFVFEGTTADAYETTLTVTDPTADRTITLPDSTGTVALTSDLSSYIPLSTFDAKGDILVASADNTVAKLTAGTNGYILTANSSATNGIEWAAAPISLPSQTGNSGKYLTTDGTTASWGIVDLSSKQDKITGVSDTEIGYLDGVTSAIQTQIDSKAPTANASFTGTFSAPSGTITSTMIADGTIVNADINASAAIALSKLATDPLARANHTGTQTASTISDFDTQVRTSKITDLTAPTSAFSMNSQKITSLATPTADADAATKAYVDAATSGLNVHASVKAATIANINLNNAVENNDVLDGVTLSTGDRILVKNQNTASQNGVYTVAGSGAPTRATDYDTAGEVDAGDFIFVEGGTVNGKTGWVQTNVITTLGSDNIEFTQFSGAGTYSAGTGLTLTGTTFSINTATTADLSTAQTLTNKTINLTSNTLSGTIAQFNTALSDGDFATLAGSETLTNKTINGSNNTITNISLTSGVTGTLPVANGGTGITSLGTGIATFLGTPSSANLASAVTDETGSGSLVFATSPTLITPILGVASATSINGTTIPSSKTLVVTTDKISALAVTSSSELAGVISDETGSGSLVFGTAPSFTTAITLNATGELRLADTDSTHYVGFKSPGTVTTNKIWTLPSTDGTSGQVLSTNGSATLSWSTPAAGAAFSELMLIGA